MSKKLIEIEKALGEIRPFLQSDGGNIELVSFENDVVQVRLLGNCKDTKKWGRDDNKKICS
jgi:Fe-S cluster biogenesis protein NfuA